MYKKKTLSNGLRIITHPMSGRQSIALGIWLKVGGRYENAQNKGISHFLEHLIFKGSKKHSCRQIKEKLEGVGGSLNGFTSEELTCYLVRIPSKHTDLALDVLSDMALNPLIKSGDVDKERTVILEEIKMYKDLPQSYVHELLDELLWPGQPLGLSIAGSVETVSAMSRTDIYNFKEAHYTAPNIVVAATGALMPDEFCRKVERIFGARRANTPNVFAGAFEKQMKPQLSLLDKGTEQSHLALGFHALPREHELKYALGLLHIILGANMSSRLFNEVREKRGLAYEIGTQVKRFSDTGAFIIHAGIDNKKVIPTIEVILAELGKMKKSLVTEDEFKRAKDFYLGQLMLALEDTMDHMLWIGESTSILGKSQSLADVIARVQKVKRADLQKAARLIFIREKMSCAVIGPLESIRGELSRQIEGGM